MPTSFTRPAFSITFDPSFRRYLPVTSGDAALRAGVLGAWAANAGLNTFAHTILPKDIREESRSAPDLPTDPARWAFAIWFPIFALQGAYAVYQALPEGRANPRIQSARVPMMASLVLGAAWPVAVAYDQQDLSYGVLLGMLGTGAWAYSRLRPSVNAGPAVTPTEQVVAQVPAGLYTGWLTVAAVVGGAALAAHHGYKPGKQAAAAGLGALGAVGALVGLRKGDFAYTGAIAWGLTAVALRQRRTSATVAVVGSLAAIAGGLLANRWPD